MSHSDDYDNVPDKDAPAPPWRVVQSPEQAAGVIDEIAPPRTHAVDRRQTSAEPAPTASPGKRGSDPADPRHKAMELLTRREHSRRELTQKLVARGFEVEAAEQAVDEMAARGWQDDARYAEAMARHRMMSGQGPLRIRAELQQHGIAAGMIDAALAACEADWQALATEILQRRFGPGRAKERKEIARRGAFLQRRGFDLDAIRNALAQADD